MANIAVICDREFFRPFDQRVYKEVITLKNAGHEIEIITPHNSTKVKNIKGIKVHCLATDGIPGSTAYRILKKTLEKNYDLYYCHELDPLIYSFFLKWITKKPIIWDCHEYLVPMKKELQGNLAAFFTDIAIKIASPRVNHIVTVDNLLGNQLSKFNDVTVIPNYPTVNDFPLLKKEKVNDEINLLYVGGLTEERGLRVMIEAFKIIKSQIHAKLTLVGGFYDEKLEKWAKDFDEKNGLGINWCGWVNYQDLAPHFSKATIGLCLLQNQERYDRAIATKIYEYLIMGIPVLSSNGYLVEKLIERCKCGKSVDATKVQDVAKGIMELLNDDKLGLKCENYINYARRKFVWERRAEKLLKVVNELVLNK